MKVYLLQHSYEYEVCEDLKVDETKIIGIYSSFTKAEQVKREFTVKQGFDKFSEDCFYIDEYELDKDHWTDGFVSSDEIDNDFEILKVCFTEWLDITEKPEDFWEDTKNYNALCEIHEKVYKKNDVVELAKCIQRIWSERLDENSVNLDEFIKVATNIRASLKLI